MNKIRVIVFLAVLVCVLGLVGPSWAMRSSQYAIGWSVVSSGGAPMESPHFAANGTTAQVASGLSHSPDQDLCAGYWCGGAVAYNVYLPLVVRNVGA